ncbi:MAG: homocysteine S-methyltransferase family protein, partial [Ilumatobacteraceae bacterium]
MARQPYLDAVAQRVIVFDGAFGTYVQGLDLSADDFGGPELEGCNEMLCLTRPDVIRSMHDAFFAVGVDAVETASFGSFGVVLNEYSIPEKTHELNVAAARLAREVADGYEGRDGKSRYVAGSIGPGTKLPSLGHIRFTDLRDGYGEQATALLEGGVDLFLIETCMDLLQVKAAMIACRRAMKAAGRQVPLQVQVTMETTGRMLVGSEIGAALTVLTAMKPDVIGINCATGPAEMQEHLRYLSHNSTIPLSVLPNAGLPSVVDGRTHYDLSEADLATFHRHHVEDLGIGIVGGCCGTTPDHLRAVVEAVADLEPPRRSPTFEPSVSSIYSPVTLEQDKSFLIIGERTNANGSRAFRDAMLAADWDTCSKIATEQIREGAHVLDVCVDYVGRDGSADMDEIVSRFATQASVPLVLDSTEPPVLETALQHIGGRAILNSANLEDGELPGSRLDRVFSLAREYGAAVICLLIDERGQARDVEWKLEIAHRIHQIASERYGLTASDLIFDALTFPLSTGDDDLRGDAMNTIEAIRRIKTEIPGAYTTLGVSNVSFGLNPAARHVLNSVFLHECTQAGLDSAIVHAAKIVPLSKIPDEQRDVCLDLIYDRRRPDYDPLQVLLEVFADVKSIKTVKEDRSGWPVGERLKHRIIDGDREGLTSDLEQALSEGTKALDIVNDVLLDGMRVVGELFGSGQMQLPFVLQSAETMKTSVAYLEPRMEKVEGGGGKGRIVLATVKGDVHDIGKNLVDIILTNNGYEVHNIGIKAPLSAFVDKAKEV